jgi:hypothetical protein
MIKFKNTDYTLNDQGQWAPATAPNKLANQAMAKFLDNQHDIYLNSQPEPQAAPAATAAPQQTAAPAATTPEQPADATQSTTTPTATDTQVQQPVKGFGDKSIPVTPTTVTQVTPSSAAPKTKVDADNLIKQTAGDPEKIKAMLAALQVTTERAPA